MMEGLIFALKREETCAFKSSHFGFSGARVTVFSTENRDIIPLCEIRFRPMQCTENE